jgi:Mo25-like
MLRECVKFEALAKILLHSEHFYDFFKYVEVSTFDIASDAFATFKVINLSSANRAFISWHAVRYHLQECYIFYYLLVSLSFTKLKAGELLPMPYRYYIQYMSYFNNFII